MLGNIKSIFIAVAQMHLAVQIYRKGHDYKYLSLTATVSAGIQSIKGAYKRSCGFLNSCRAQHLNA